MKAEEKCVSLETAKKLKEAGWTTPTERWWYVSRLWTAADIGKFHTNEVAHFLQAPDSQELGEALPRSSFNDNKPYWKTTKWQPEKSGWELEVKCGGEYLVENFNNEAEARATAWLWLRENKLI